LFYPNFAGQQQEVGDFPISLKVCSHPAEDYKQLGFNSIKE